MFINMVNKKMCIFLYFNLKEREALKNEVSIFKDLSHKHIVRFYDAINRPDGLFLFIEYMPQVISI